ncbi:hypothetical protein V8C26DRAFT_413613 [Trichoderma gracile]
MAHYQCPHQPPHPGAVELDTSNSSRYDGEVFEMPGDSAVPKAEREQQRRPVQAQDEELDGMQANPWPFYLDQDVRTEASARGDAAEAAVGAGTDANGKGEETGKGVEGKAERPLANPWAYFGPMSPSEDVGGHKAAAAANGQDVGGLGIRVEGSGDAKAKSESQDAPAAASAPHHGTPGEQGADGPPPSDPAAPTGEPSSSSPPAPAFYPAPLRLSRKDVPPAAAPAFKPYVPPTDDVPAVAPLNVKHQRRSSDGPQGEAITTLPYRPYRPAGHGEHDGNHRADTAAPPAPVMPPQPVPAQSHRPPVTGAVAPQGMSPQVTTWSPSGSPNPAQQQPASPPTDTPYDGMAPHQPLHHPSQPPPSAETRPSPPPVAAPPVPPHPPLSSHSPSAVAPAVTAPPPPPPPIIQASVPAIPPPPSVPAPSPYPHTPYYANPVQPSSPHHHTSPSPSSQHPATGYHPSSSPTPGLQPYGHPHSAPTSALPSPAIVPFQFQATTQAQPHNLYPVPAPTPPLASHTPPAPIPSPGPVSYHPPPQHFTPPPPTSSYDIPQPTYASASEIPPPQPPRPQFQQVAMGAYQYSPQPSPQAQPPSYDYAGTPSPVAQPPVSPQPSPYQSPHGPAIAPHQHHYPVQPTYAAASNGNSPSSPDPQGQYAVPPLPPRPATAQPQLFAGFTSQNVVVFPPPPKRVFSPPPGAAAAGAAPPPPRRQSGGSSGRLFSSSSALKWIDKTGKGLEHKLDAVLGSQGSSSKPPPQPPRPT